ncbi:MAG: RteC domain-containing protein [Labilibaculum sp.]|nr:RteC domain-containing protein [Labilibaculum sp.]
MLFYQAAFELESFRMIANMEAYKKHLGTEMGKIAEYFEENHVKVQYYRCNFKHLDEKYFTRNEPDIPVQLKNHFSLIDEAFFTWHDHTFSVIMAFDLLLEHIRKELRSLNSGSELLLSEEKSQMHWTGSKVALVELIYALQGSGMIDHGNVGIKELASRFECLFNTDLKDYYRSWIEIKQRKIEPTKFIDLLQTVLRSRIEESGN